jgi:hypothetical protein
MGKALRRYDCRSVDNFDVLEEIVRLREGASANKVRGTIIRCTSA